MIIPIGWDEINVYGNENGDVCISQKSPIEGQEVVICVPFLYCQLLINEINREMSNED
jgi:hypothetical protein